MNESLFILLLLLSSSSSSSSSLVVVELVVIVPWTHSNEQAAPITVHKSVYHKSHSDEFTTVLLHTGDDERLNDCFMRLFTPWWWASWCFVMLSVILIQLCVFVGWHCGNRNIFGTQYIINLITVCFLPSSFLHISLVSKHRTQ